MSSKMTNQVCSTCLCGDRKLFLLYRLSEGINLLHTMLMSDQEAYMEGFFKDAATWVVCWECRAIIEKIKRFQLQACTALKTLKDIAAGRNEKVELLNHSHLSIHHIPAKTECSTIDRPEVETIKKEYTEELQNSPEHTYENETNSHYEDTELNKTEHKPFKNVSKPRQNKNKLYSLTVMNNDELKMAIDKRKSELNEFKCDSCVLGFESDIALNTHILKLHSKKENHSVCTICLTYIKDEALDTHTKKHYRSYTCKLCAHISPTHKQIVEHLNEMHGKIVGSKKKQLKKASLLDESVSYPCSECDMTFKNKGAKWKHVQKSHRAGHKCETCGKIFSFKHNLERHELSHTGSHPRTPCPTCNKQVRTSLLRCHMRTHAARAPHACGPCGASFRARAGYHAHLKYARAHAPQDVLRYPCSSCDKKYRSAGELRDHIAYRHENQPRHKCPICDKGLATRRCVTRHVRRAHDGIKENARDKMCDYCGQTFRDKKSLREHVWRHTGARPLSCARCGRAFRQRAALHAHLRRLHAHELT